MTRNEPLKIRVGSTRYQQPVELEWYKGSDGEWSWKIIQQPANQRDELRTIDGLTTETLIAIARWAQKERPQ